MEKLDADFAIKNLDHTVGIGVISDEARKSLVSRYGISFQLIAELVSRLTLWLASPNRPIAPGPKNE